MSYAVKTGTAQAFWINSSATPVGCVRFDGELTVDPVTKLSLMIWDAGLNNIRTMTAQEIAALPAQAVLAAHPLLVAALTDSTNFQAKLLKAFVLTALDELNLHALKMKAIMDAIDSSTTYATLKTNIAAVVDYPQRTKANLINAMTTKINAGDPDS